MLSPSICMEVKFKKKNFYTFSIYSWIKRLTQPQRAPSSPQEYNFFCWVSAKTENYYLI